MIPITEISLGSSALNFTGTGTGSVGVSMEVEPIQKTNWCWAAVAVSVSKHYNKQSKWTQCLLACAELEKTTCCDKLRGGSCNVTHDIDKALSRTQNLGKKVLGKISEDDIEAALKGKMPVVIRVEFADGKGHFLAIVAIKRDANGMTGLTLSDPAYGDMVVTPSELNGTYKLSGRWTHTFTTKPS